MDLRSIRYSSRGYLVDPPALFHPYILVGAGQMLTPEFVKKHKISHVINCGEESDSPSWFKEKTPENYFCVNAVDSFEVNILDWYPQFKETLKQYIQDPTSTKVFVHCRCGINRSAFLALMYVCDVFKFPVGETEMAVLRQRPCMMLNTCFRQQVFCALNNGKS